MKTSSLIIFILSSLALCADSQKESANFEAPYAIEGDLYLDQTRDRWDQFEEEMKWFLVYSNHDQALIRHLAKAQDSFFELRHAIYDGIAADWEEGAKGVFPFQARSLLKLTDWYTNFIEETFFPKGWEELYQKAYLEKQASK